MNIGSVKSMKESNLMILQEIKKNLTCENSRDYDAIQAAQNGLKNLLNYIADFGFDQSCGQEAAKILQNRKHPQQPEDPPHIQA